MTARFKKILLASLVAASSSAFAMESLDEEALSDATGQTGVLIGITPPAMSFSVVLHDTDGYTGATDSGAIVFGDPYAAVTRLKTQLSFTGEVVMKIDATGDNNGAVAGGVPALNVNVAIPGMTFQTGDIYAADTDATGTLAGMQALSATKSSIILNNMTMTFGSTTLNFELGTAATENQGAMLVVNTSMATGFSITGFKLNDANSGGFLGTDLTIKDNGGAALTLKANVDFISGGASGGMRVSLAQFGHATNGADIRLGSLKFGDATTPVIGNVDIVGLVMNNTVVRVAGY